MSRHTNQPDCLNFYPAAPRRWRFGYPTFGTLAFAQQHEAFASAKAKEPNLAFPLFFLENLKFIFNLYKKTYCINNIKYFAIQTLLTLFAFIKITYLKYRHALLNCY